jgi:hypothetical protein
MTAAGGSGAIVVTTGAGCSWSAQSNAPWIAITSGTSGAGPATVAFSVAASTGPARSGTMTIAGYAVTVSQSSGCRYTISPTAQTMPWPGGPGSIAVSAGDGCLWTTAGSAPWARITSGHSGAGAGTVGYVADVTPSSVARSTTFSVAGQTFTLNQEGAPCSSVVSPSSVALDSNGGSGVFEVNIAEGCTWTAVSNDAWLQVTAGPSGSGDGTVGYSVDVNPGPARTGTIVAGNRTFTVSQAAP